MLKSTPEGEQVEFELIREPAHIEKVWSAIEANLPAAFERLNAGAAAGGLGDELDDLRARFGGSGRTAPVRASAADLRRHFAKAVEQVQKEQDRYKKLMNEQVLEEYREDDPKGFKTALMKKCPIIMGTVRSKQRELLEWQQLFKRTKSQELLDVFANLVEFADEYIEKHRQPRYGDLDSLEGLALDEPETEAFTVVGLIGMGIKSSVLHHLSPSLFPLRGKRDLYALSFLTNQAYFGLPSATSEFIMVNDNQELQDGRNYRMDQNYWYPYGLFTLYCLRIYRSLEKWCAGHDVRLDPNYRYVYVHRLFESICDHHSDHIRTMMGGDVDVVGH